MKKRGFTLIEVLLVISIIVLLMTLLVPAIGAAVRAVKIANAERVVITVHQAVIAYHTVYAGYPLDRTPNRNMDLTKDTSYRPYQYADGRIDGTLGTPSIFNDDADWKNMTFGGKFLVYFLMGPTGSGWHRPVSALASDPNYRNRYITAEWDPPPALSSILVNQPVEQGLPKPFAVFADGFTLEGPNGGVIGYLRANVFSSAATGRWTISYGPFSAAMYADCRSAPSYPGDGQGEGQLAKILAQCPESLGFMVISPGPDGKYGYRIPVTLFNGVYRKGSWSDLAAGLTDDIANFPLK